MHFLQFVAVATVIFVTAPLADTFQSGASAPFKRSLSFKTLNHRIPSLPIRPAHWLRLKGGFRFGSLNTIATATAPVAAAPVEKFRKDYRVPDYSIRTVDLTFKIFKGHTQVYDSIRSVNDVRISFVDI